MLLKVSETFQSSLLPEDLLISTEVQADFMLSIKCIIVQDNIVVQDSSKDVAKFLCVPKNDFEGNSNVNLSHRDRDISREAFKVILKKKPQVTFSGARSLYKVKSVIA
jgi:hypothetical protein